MSLERPNDALIKRKRNQMSQAGRQAQLSGKSDTHAKAATASVRIAAVRKIETCA
jgi:hypothetical protein